MQKTAISWTDYSSNPIRVRRKTDGKLGWYCQKVSQGCTNCYAETLNGKFGTATRYDVNALDAVDVFFDAGMADKLYTVKDPAKVFMFDMTDFFADFITDVQRAAAWAVLLDLPQHTFQVLTKRPENAVTWGERFAEAVSSPAFAALRDTVTQKRVRTALDKASSHPTAWADHIWVGASVENAAATTRINALRQCGALVKFISAEPLLGAWGSDVDLSGVSWLICGGESGGHMTDVNHPRWMKPEWAREVRDLCAKFGVAFFMKQDSGFRTELRTYLVEQDGSKWFYQQFPDAMTPPWRVDTPKPERATRPAFQLRQEREWRLRQSDTAPDKIADVSPVTTQDKKPTTLVNFHDVKDHWDPVKRQWDSPDYVYIGRFNATYNLPESPLHNPFKLDRDTPENRAGVLEQYRAVLRKSLEVQPALYDILKSYKGKTLVCWCTPKICHGDVLVEIIDGEASTRVEPTQQPAQLSLFDVTNVETPKKTFNYA